MRRVVVMTAAAVSLGLVLSACNQGTDDVADAPSTAATGDPNSVADASTTTTTTPASTDPATTATTSPATTTPATTTPASTEPPTTDPATTAPATTDPATTEPATTEPATTEPATTDPATTAPATTDPATTDPATTDSTTTSTIETTTTTTVEPTTTVGPTTTVAETTTTTTVFVPVPGQPNPTCLVTVVTGDSLETIAAAARSRLNNPEISVDAIRVENGIANPDLIAAGLVLDLCVGNKIDDATGLERPEFVPPPPLEVPQGGTNFGSGVAAQQQKLNELLTPYGFPALTVDGDSGRQTRQALCAARIGMGLPASREDMVPGSIEEAQLQSAGGLRIPDRSDTGYNHWALIDLHCQVMFAGEGRDRIVFVFPVSSGQAEFPTRLQSASRAFRYDPARDNGGWHDSRDYPASVDNPLNGNMYKPVYFDGGQAIHGANSVPTSPASHGCIRLRVGHQDMLINWLGLDDAEREMWDARDRIGLTVTIIGQY